MYLFSSIQYSIGDNVVMETLNNPGQTTSILGYLTYPDDFNTSSGLNQCWAKDTTDNANSNEFLESAAVAADAAIVPGHFTPRKNPNYNQGFAIRRSYLLNADDNTRGNFSFCIPFTHIFGFSEYQKIIYNVKHSLRFTRAADTLALHRANGVVDGKVELINISWKLPSIQPSIESKIKLMEQIKNKISYPIYFNGRSDQHTSVPQDVMSFDWRLSVRSGIQKPRWIIVGFQTNKKTTQEQNPAVFNHLNLERCCVQLNDDVYPKKVESVNFGINDYSVMYKTVDDFKREYYTINNLIGRSQINPATFKSLFPIIVFNVKNQSEELKTGVIDILLNFFFRQGVPADTHAYAVILSDRIFKADSDGQNIKLLSY